MNVYEFTKHNVFQASPNSQRKPKGKQSPRRQAMNRNVRNIESELARVAAQLVLWSK